MAGERRLYLERNCRLPESPAHSRRRNREGPASSKGLNSQRGFGPAVEPRRKSRPRSTSLYGSSPCKCQRLSTLRWDRLPPSRPSTKSGARAGGRRLSDRRLHRWLAGTSASAPSSHGAADLLGLNRAHICVRNLPFFALVIAGGVAAFLGHVVWMKRHSRPGPAARPRPDYGVWHAVQALIYLALATVVGVCLVVVPLSEATLRVVLPYGVFGLIGFLAQIVLGIESRLLPLFAWYGAFANSGFERPLVSPHQMPDRAWQRLAFYLWLGGVPALAAGFYFNVAPVLATAAWCLLAAVVLGALNSAAVLRHTFAKPRGHRATSLTTPLAGGWV